MDIKEIVVEAKTCLNCKIPMCVAGCPLSMDIPKFITLVKENNFKKAYEVVINNNPFGAVCGIVCPHEVQCQGKCIRGIKGDSTKIGVIEAFICEYGLKNFDTFRKN